MSCEHFATLQLEEETEELPLKMKTRRRRRKGKRKRRRKRRKHGVSFLETRFEMISPTQNLFQEYLFAINLPYQIQITRKTERKMTIN
jgi:hypothetical protein